MKILFVGLHNNSERLVTLNDTLVSLLNEFKTFSPTKILLSWQPNKLRISKNLLCTRLFQQYLLESKYRRYIGYKMYLLLRFMKVMWEIVKSQTDKSKQVKKTYKQISLSKKHLMAIELFLNTDNDYLIILEDDAEFMMNKGAIDEFKTILKLKKTGYLYIDLAGGISLNKLTLEQAVGLLYKEKCFFQLQKPITNTTCSYLINRNLGERIIEETIINERYIKHYPIDWVYNKILMKIVDSKQEIHCLHATSKFLLHGSKNGKFQSTLED